MGIPSSLSPGSLAGGPCHGVPPLRRSNRTPKPINCASRSLGRSPRKQQQQRQRKCNSARNDSSCSPDYAGADVLDKESDSAVDSAQEDSDDEDDAPPTKRAKVGGYADAMYTAEEADKVYQSAPLSYNKNTNSQYTGILKVFEWWCQYEPECPAVAEQPTGSKAGSKGKRKLAKQWSVRAQPYEPNFNGQDGAHKAARFLRWCILDGKAGYKGQPAVEYSSDASFKKTHAALAQLYQKRGQALAASDSRSKSGPGTAKLLDDAMYKAAYKECQGSYKVQPSKPLPGNMDPQDNSLQDTFDLDDLVKIASEKIASSSTKDARDLSMLLWMCWSCGRGDDCRPRKLCELMRPMSRRTIGPSPCWVVGMVQMMGKTLGDDFGCKGIIRHKDPLLCAQGAMGRWLIIRFTIDKEPFPSPTSDEWRETVIWTGLGPTQPLCYAAHSQRLKQLFDLLGIKCNKVTHSARIFAARFAEEAGLSDAEIARLGFWNLCEMQLCYLLTGLKPSILLAMAGWEKDQLAQFWHERFTVPCPASLIELLMPWFSTFKAAIVQAEQEGKKVYPSAYGLQKLMPYLCWAVVQDALELCSGERPTAFKNNPVHQLLMTSNLFKSMLLEYPVDRALGLFESSRPLTQEQKIDKMMQMLHQESCVRHLLGPAALQPQQQLPSQHVLSQLQQEVNPAIMQQLLPLLQPTAQQQVKKLLAAAAAAPATPLGAEKEMLAPVEVVTGGEEEELVHQELQQEVQQQQQQQQHGAITEDLEITMQVEPPGSPVSSAQADVSQPGGVDGNAAAPATAAVSPPYNSRGKDLCLYSPGGGLRPKSEMLHRPQMTPGGKHQNFCWVAGDFVGSGQQQPVLPAATIMQQLLQLQQENQLLKGQLQQQQQVALERQPQLQQQQQQQQQIVGMMASRQVIEPDINALTKLLEPTIASLPATATAFSSSSNSSTDSSSQKAMDLLLYVAFQGGMAGAKLARDMQQQEGQICAEPAVLSRGQQAQAKPMGALLDSQAARAGAADGIGQGDAIALSGAAGAGNAAADQRSDMHAVGLPPLGSHTSFTALWQWYNSPEPNQTLTRRQMEEGKDRSWRKGGQRRQLWPEYEKLLKQIEAVWLELVKLRHGDVPRADAAAALDAYCRSQGISLVKYHTKYLKYSGRTAAPSAASISVALLGVPTPNTTAVAFPPGPATSRGIDNAAAGAGELTATSQKRGRGSKAA